MRHRGRGKPKVLMLASVASMIDQFNMSNIKLLINMGYEVHVTCNFKEGNTCDARRIRQMQETLWDMHVVLHQWDCPRSIHSVIKCGRAYRQLWRLTDEHHYSWIHCHSPIGGALARLVAHRRRIWVVYTAHGFHFYYGAPWKNWLLYYPAEVLLAHWTDVLVTVNREDYYLAKQRLQAGRVYYIPGAGIDCARFRTKAKQQQVKFLRESFCRKYHIPEDASVLLSVGELNKGKNHKIVIDALAELSRQDVYYLICGQGSMKKKLMRYAENLGVGGQIRMPGYQQKMEHIYSQADIFVFPSLREGMPAALMEAMAAGLPCVVSDIRGNRELIGNKPKNMRFSPKHPSQLVPVLEELLADPVLRKECGMQNQKKVQRYDQKIVQQRMKKIYAQAAWKD